MFALALSVFSSDADAFVSFTIFVHIAHLIVESFLYAEDVRLLIFDHHRRSRIAVFP